MLGHVKLSFRNEDHDSWILLNGRALTELESVHMRNAIKIGFVGNLPVCDDVAIELLASNTVEKDVKPAETFTLNEANLPNIPNIPCTI